MGTYARAVGTPKLSARSYWLNKQEYEKAKEYVTIEGESHILTLPEEVLNEKGKSEVVYHTQAVATGRVESATEEEIEECLKNIANKIVMIERGSGFGTVVVTFKSEEDASLYATTVLRTEKIIMAPSYKGKRLTKIRVGRVPVKISVEWVLACLFKNEDIEIVEVGTTAALNWWGVGIECWVNVTPDQIEKLPYEIVIKNGKRLNVIVYGKKPTCYFCKQVGHFKKFCPEKKEEEEKNVELVVETGGSETEKKVLDKEEDVEKEEGEITETEKEGIYEKVSSDSGEFMCPKKKRKKKQEVQDSKPELEQVKKKKNNGEEKMAEGNMEETLIIIKERGKKDTEEEVRLVREEKMTHRAVKGIKKELMILKRKDYIESGLNKLHKSEEVLGVVEAGQKVNRKAPLKEFLRMRGRFKEELLEMEEMNYCDLTDED